MSSGVGSALTTLSVNTLVKGASLPALSVAVSETCLSPPTYGGRLTVPFSLIIEVSDDDHEINTFSICVGKLKLEVTFSSV
ncbi:hypothetical protein D1872_282200 [compost metagenome]